MKKIIMILIFILMTSFVYANGTYEIEITKSDDLFINDSYIWHVTCTENGGIAQNQTINYLLKDTSNNTLRQYDPVTTDQNGYAFVPIVLPGDVSKGDYIVEFTIGSSIINEVINVRNNDFSLEVSPKNVLPNEQVNLSGTFKGESNKIEIHIYDLNRQIIAAYAPEVNDDDEFTLTFDRPSVPGTYFLEATVNDHVQRFSFNVFDFATTITYEDEFVVPYGELPNLSDDIIMVQSNGVKKNVPVHWDLTDFSPSIYGIYYLEGTAGNYHFGTYVKVNRNDDEQVEGIIENAETRAFRDMVPLNGFKTKDQKNKALRELDNEFEYLPTSPSFDQVQTLLSKVTLAFPAITKVESLEYSKKIRTVIEDNMKNYSMSDAAHLVYTYINNTKNAYYDALTSREKITYNTIAKKLINDLLEEKSTLNTAVITKSKITSVYNNAMISYNLIKDGLKDQAIIDDYKLRVKTDDSFILDKDATDMLVDNEAPLLIDFALGTIEAKLPAKEALKITFTENSDSLNIETLNGHVEEITAFNISAKNNNQSLKNFKVILPLGSYDVKDLTVGFYSNNQWEKLNYQIVNDRVVFTAPTSGIYGLMTYKISFRDIDHWSKDNIISLASKGLVSGKNEETFNTEGLMTRSEFLTILVNALSLSETSNDNFADESSWYTPYLSIAKDYGLDYGTKDNVFRANDPITREEIAVLIYRAFSIKHGLELDEQGNIFYDNSDIAQDARVAVYAMKASGIISGYEDNTFKPKNTATRGEAAAIIKNFIE